MIVAFEKVIVRPGRIDANLEMSFTGSNAQRNFEARLRELLQSDSKGPDVIDWNPSERVLRWKASHALPASGPIGHLLLFGNPTAASAKKEQMFAGEGEDQQRVHRVWRVLRQAGLVPPGVANESRALNEYFSFPPASSQRLGLSSFVSLPSPSSGERYVGVAGVLRLFGAADFRQLLELEGDWLTSHVFPRIDNAGRVLVFQAHAWRFLSSAEPRTLRGLELRKMPPTRHIFSTRAVAELQELADIGCHL